MDHFPSRERSAAAALEPRVSAIVVTRNAGPSLDLCIRSALVEDWIDDVVIVDAGNPEPVSSALRALQADRRDVKIVTAPIGAGLAKACNVGATAARGRWLLFLDPQVVLQRGAVTRMAAAGGGAHAPWIVGGRLTDTHGRDKPAIRGGALSAWSAVAVAMDWPGPRPFRKKPEEGEAAKVAAVSGALMLVPRADFQELGGFDEAFATDAADLDLCHRATEAGGTVLFQPEAAGVQFAAGRRGRREAQGLARFAAKTARTPFQRAFAMIAGPVIGTLLLLRDVVGGRRPLR